MRRPMLSACALLASFALGVATTLLIQKSEDVDFRDVPGAAALDDILLDADCPTPRVTVTRDGMIYLNRQLVGDLDNVEPLETHLRVLEGYRLRVEADGQTLSRCERQPGGVPAGREVEVKAPRSIPYGDLMRVLAAAKASGPRPVRLTFEEDGKRF